MSTRPSGSVTRFLERKPTNSYAGTLGLICFVRTTWSQVRGGHVLTSDKQGTQTNTSHNYFYCPPFNSTGESPPSARPNTLRKCTQKELNYVNLSGAYCISKRWDTQPFGVFIFNVGWQLKYRKFGTKSSAHHIHNFGGEFCLPNQFLHTLDIDPRGEEKQQRCNKEVSLGFEPLEATTYCRNRKVLNSKV